MAPERRPGFVRSQRRHAIVSSRDTRPPAIRIRRDVGVRLGDNCRRPGADHVWWNGSGRMLSTSRSSPRRIRDQRSHKPRQEVEGSTARTHVGSTERNTSLDVVGEGGFEPPTACSQSRNATKLRHSPVSGPPSTSVPNRGHPSGGWTTGGWLIGGSSNEPNWAISERTIISSSDHPEAARFCSRSRVVQEINR